MAATDGAEEFTWLRGRTKRAVKVTLVSAQQAAAYYDPDKSHAAYPTRDAYLADMVDFTRREIPELAASGASTCRSTRRSTRRSSTRRFAKATVSAAAILIGCSMPASNWTTRSSTATGRHVRHPHLSRQSQEHVLRVGRIRPHRQQIFSRSRFQRFLLKYNDERSGTFEPLAHVPDDRIVVLGLVSSKQAAARIARRFAAASRRPPNVMPLDRLALSPQCGFASTQEGNRLTPDDQRRKLELVASVARDVWA